MLPNCYTTKGGPTAEYVGITEANLSLLKQGRVKAVRFETLARICEFLGCAPGDILIAESASPP
ncbi:helix-turn-helix transcriptional regulator [Methylosinus sp. R-45379]|uniref:helix-turn-helix domain-containing protein n=1 Tax=Methylosinus sp. R-45379 TaxID=980563 RepID=UPI000A05E932|nr:helix-turn-helix domain-containing protein [Methylosinus sp. R-45379]